MLWLLGSLLNRTFNFCLSFSLKMDSYFVFHFTCLFFFLEKMRHDYCSKITAFCWQRLNWQTECPCVFSGSVFATKLKQIRPLIVRLQLMDAVVLQKWSGLCRQSTLEYTGRSKLKICLTNFSGDGDGGGIALCMKTDALDSRCWKRHLHNLDGRKMHPSAGGRAGGGRTGKERLSNYPSKPNLRCCWN